MRVQLLAISLLIGTLSYGQSGTNEAPTIERKSCTAPDGVTLVYSAAGSGKVALVFIHGGLANREFWDHELRTFASQYRVIAPDLAGHGESGTNRQKWGIPEFGADVRAVVEAEHLDKVVLFGNSVGGPIAIEAAMQLPGKVLGVVGVDTFHNFDWISPAAAHKRAEAFRADYAGSMKEMIKILFHADADPSLVADAEERMLRTSPQAAYGILQSLGGYDLGSSVRRLPVPLRAINGDLYPTDIEGNRKVKADFDAVVMKHMGHYPMLERPDEFDRLVAAVVGGFLQLRPNRLSAAEPGVFVETDWLAMHSADSNVVILQVGRDRAGYDSGHIPNALFLPFADIAVTRNGVPNQLPPPEQLKAAFEKIGVGDGMQVVFYDDSAGLFAARASFGLAYLGHGSQAALLDGGLEKWTLESRPVSKVTPSPTPTSLTARPRPELIVDRQQVRQMLKDGDVILIDARPPDEYSGVKLTAGASRAGHIPGARNVYWMDNLMSAQNPVLISLSEIRKKYERAGAVPGKRIVVYCRAGVQAAHDYLTLKMLGYKAAVYDGSFFEWSNTEGMPVESLERVGVLDSVHDGLKAADLERVEKLLDTAPQLSTVRNARAHAAALCQRQGFAEHLVGC